MARIYRFGPYKLDSGNLILERDGRAVPLRPKLVTTLSILVEKAPDVVTKEELMRRVWPDVTVVESSLTRNISELRSELESGCPGQSAIETLPKRGYRFSLPIERVTEPVAPARRSAGRRWLAAAAVCGMVAVAVWSLSGPPADAENAPGSGAYRVAEAAFRSGFAEYSSWTPEGVEAAVFQFERSIRAEPELWYGHYGSTAAQLAALLISGESEPDAKARLLAAADRAVLYGPEIAVTHAARGSALLIASWDWEGAAREIEKGIRWNPKNPIPYERRGLWKTLRGRFDEARSDYDHALALQPDLDDCRLARAFNELCARRYSEVVAGVLEVLPRTQKQQPAHRLLTAAYSAMGDWTAAEQAAAKAGLSDFRRIELRVLRFAAEGKPEDARAARQTLASMCTTDADDYCDTAAADAALGDHDAAFTSLEQGLRQRHWALLVHSVDPRLDALHKDARWDEIMAAIRPALANP